MVAAVGPLTLVTPRSSHDYGMDTELTRRRFLNLAGVTGLGTVLAACTAKSSSTAPDSAGATSATNTSPASTAPASSSSPAPTFKDLGHQLGDRLATPGRSSYKPSKLLYNPRFAGQQKPKASPTARAVTT